MINIAYAQEVAAQGTSMSSTLVQLIAIFAIFYFILIRPQQKKMKAHEALINAVKKGDKVVTGGGIVGKIVNVNETEVEVEVSNNTIITVMKATLRDVVVTEEKTSKKEKKKEKKAKK